ncbi:MarR family transcriptional regulator [bacterium]|nr:MarR family transcriptional regulator [bacterium]
MSFKKKVDKYYLKTIHEVIQVGHWITDQVSDELKEFGITEPQYNVLRILKKNKDKEISVQDIQKKMFQKSSNVSRIIDKLLEKEYVDRAESSGNRRKVDISLTKKGNRSLKVLDEKVYEFHLNIQKKLKKDDLSDLLRILGKIEQ